MAKHRNRRSSGSSYLPDLPLQDTDEIVAEYGRFESSMKRKCPRCPDLFRSTTAFNRHFREKHGSTGIRKSEKQARKSGSHGASGSGSSRRYSCHLCQSTYSSRQGLYVHVNANHEDKRYQCSHCSSSMSSKSHLNRHVRDLHTDGDIYQCDRCQYNSKSRRNLQAHKRKNRH